MAATSVEGGNFVFFSPFVSQHTKALGGRYRVYIAPAHILLIKNGENGCWNVLFILSIFRSIVFRHEN